MDPSDACSRPLSVAPPGLPPSLVSTLHFLVFFFRCVRGPGKWERKLGSGLMDLDDVDAVKTRAGTVSAASVIDVRITLSGLLCGSKEEMQISNGAARTPIT